MTRPPLDPKEMRDLAVRMSRVNPEARRLLRRFVDGETTPTDALAVFRACVRNVLYPEPGTRAVSRDLRADLGVWVAAHGAGRDMGGDPAGKRVSVWWPELDLDAVDRAAKLARVDRSTYIRQAANAAAQRDLGTQNVDAA